MVSRFHCSLILFQYSIQDNGSAKFFQGALHTPNMGEKVAQVKNYCFSLFYMNIMNV